MGKATFRLCGAVMCLFLLTAVQARADELVGIGGMCLDVKNRGGKGTPVIVWPCNGQGNQDWYYDSDARTINTRDGLCLDVKGRGGQGTQVIVWECNGQSNQKWYPKRDNTIRTPDGMCLDVKGGKAVQGASVIIWPCKSSNNNANQRWRDYRR